MREETTTPKHTKELKMTGCGRARSTLGNFCAAANEPLQTALASASKYPDIIRIDEECCNSFLKNSRRFGNSYRAVLAVRIR